MARRLVYLALLLAFARPVVAQVLPGSPKNITVVSGGGTCNSPDTACATYTFGAQPSITFDIGGTFTGTLTFEGTANGTTWRTISVTKLSDGTTATTATAAGQFSIGNAGLLRVRVRATAFASGAAVVFGTGGTASAKVLSPAVTSILSGDGSAAAPAWAFTSDPDTGVYRVGTNDIGVSTGGTLRLDVSTTDVTSTLPITSAGNMTAGASSGHCFTGRGCLKASADGIFNLLDNAGTSFGRLTFGGTTSAFPAIKRNATALNFRLADDSADAPITSALDTVNVNAIAAVSTDGLVLSNATAATAGVPVQLGPRLRWHGNVWNTTATAATNTDDWWMEALPASAATPSSIFKLVVSLNGAAGTTALSVNNFGSVTSGGNMGIGATAAIISGNNIMLSGATPSISSGFGTSPSVTAGKSFAFRVNVGTGGAATTGVITVGATAATGWNCSSRDLTNNASFVTEQTASTTTTASFANYSRTTGLAIAWTASDILAISCTGF